jgi:hypothetical protein
VKDRDAVPVGIDGKIALPVRSPKLVELAEQYSKLLMEKMEENRKAHEAGDGKVGSSNQPDHDS